MSNGLPFGGIGAVDNSTAETTTDATPRKIANFGIAGEYNRVTVSIANDNLVIQEAGTYNISGHVSFSGTLSKTFLVRAYKNTTPIGVPLERKMGTGGDVGSASFCGLSQLEIGDEISAYQWSSDGGTSFTAQQISLVVTRLV